MVNNKMRPKLFGTDGIRGGYGKYPVTERDMEKIGGSVARILKSENKNKIIIGRDTRQSGLIIEQALVKGICNEGVNVILVGEIPTAGVAFLTKKIGTDAGIIITASHNPCKDNGIKIFSKEGVKLEKGVEEKIEKQFSLCSGVNEKRGKVFYDFEKKKEYVNYLKGADNGDQNLRIVVDCANGSACSVKEVFENYNVEFIGDSPNGNNINLGCGALFPSNLRDVVLKNKADIGISFDGDSDRVVIVDEKGEELNGDHILAINAKKMIMNRELKENVVVATDYSNLGLDNYLESVGGKVVRVQNGDKYVVEEMIKKDYTLGGERTGHIVYSGFVKTGDGILAALNILKIMKQEKLGLSKLKKILVEYPQILINVDVREKKDFVEMKDILREIQKAEDVLGKKGRVFVRYSGTENKCRVMVEGEDEEKITSLARDISKSIKKEIGVK